MISRNGTSAGRVKALARLGTLCRFGQLGNRSDRPSVEWRLLSNARGARTAGGGRWHVSNHPGMAAILAIALRLQFEQLGVTAILSEQFLVRADGFYLPFIEHQNAVRHADAGKTV
jgi:hypothetical protein